MRPVLSCPHPRYRRRAGSRGQYPLPWEKDTCYRDFSNTHLLLRINAPPAVQRQLNDEEITMKKIKKKTHNNNDDDDDDDDYANDDDDD